MSLAMQLKIRGSGRGKALNIPSSMSGVSYPRASMLMVSVPQKASHLEHFKVMLPEYPDEPSYPKLLSLWHRDYIIPAVETRETSRFFPLQMGL